MIVLSDNDIVLKLAAFDLLDAALSLLQVAPSDVFVLDTAKYVFRKNRDKFAGKYTLAGMDRAIAFVENARQVTEAPDITARTALANIEKLDPGELILYLTAVAAPGSLLLTGDKNSVRALATNPVARPTFEQLTQHVICLEEIIRALITTVNFQTVRASVVPVRECDKMLQSVFGSGMQASEAPVLETLASYIADLERDTGANWLRQL